MSMNHADIRKVAGEFAGAVQRQVDSRVNLIMSVGYIGGYVAPFLLLVAGTVVGHELIPAEGPTIVRTLGLFALICIALWYFFGAGIILYWACSVECQAASIGFKQRAELAFSLDDPDLLFVNIIPRHNWKKVVMRETLDFGFLKIDRSTQRVLFEGDRECYDIPADSIVDVSMECLPFKTMGVNDPLCCALIQVRHAEAVKEIPLFPTPILRGESLGKTFRARAEKLRAEVLVMSRTASGTEGE